MGVKGEASYRGSKLFTYLPTYLSTCLPTYLPTYLLAYLPIYLSVRLYLPVYAYLSVPTCLCYLDSIDRIVYCVRWLVVRTVVVWL